jgi:hypothetical protein
MHLDVPNLREITINTLTNMHLGIRKKWRSGFEFPLNVQHVMVNKPIDLKCVYIYIVNQIRQRIWYGYDTSLNVPLLIVSKKCTSEPCFNGVRSLFQQPIAPTAHYSDSPFLRQPIIPSKMVKSSIIILKPVVFLLYLTEDWL